MTRAILASTDPQIPDQDLHYNYDAMGNRVRTIENGVTSDYVPNGLNQYVRAGGTSFLYDRDGNLISEMSRDDPATWQEIKEKGDAAIIGVGH